MRILLVEDHEDSRQMLAWLLRSEGHAVATAASASEALQVLAAEPVDLVISDIGLPGHVRGGTDAACPQPVRAAGDRDLGMA